MLETEIVETKLKLILDSLTFRYTRQPKFLRLVPERVTATDLRISEKIKLLNPEGLKAETNDKFFKPLSEDLIDPAREKEVAKAVSSIFQTLK